MKKSYTYVLAVLLSFSWSVVKSFDVRIDTSISANNLVYQYMIFNTDTVEKKTIGNVLALAGCPTWLDSLECWKILGGSVDMRVSNPRLVCRIQKTSPFVFVEPRHHILIREDGRLKEYTVALGKKNDYKHVFYLVLLYALGILLAQVKRIVLRR